ncbi:type II secretion system F family protein [Candidatus Micrarchaeota archaeon]|nr:type II secretion system F family protein [Candidatus Micrarchaeota archaeon]
MASKLIQTYEDSLEFIGWKIPAVMLILLSVVVSVVAFVAGFFLGADLPLVFLVSLLVADLGLGLPLYIANKKVGAIEKRLPDVLHHLSITLKTGGTIETALKETGRIDYGPITVGLREMLRQINEGKTFEDAFRDYALKSRSEMLEKVAIIIIAARRAGGGLLDTLDALAEDIRSVYRLRQERRSKTLMQFMFIIVAGSFVAPFVFGILRSVIQVLAKVGTSAADPTLAIGLTNQFDLMFKGFLIIESALTTFGAVQVREGKITSAVIVAPITILISYLLYSVVGGSFMGLLIGGG